MTTLIGHYFKGGEIALDGNRFRSCDFVDLTLVFNGTEAFELDGDCTFSGKIGLNIGAEARPALIMLGQMMNHPMLGVLVRKAIDQELAQGSKGPGND